MWLNLPSGEVLNLSQARLLKHDGAKIEVHFIDGKTHTLTFASSEGAQKVIDKLGAMNKPA